jgi:hypothetical protein
LPRCSSLCNLVILKAMLIGVLCSRQFQPCQTGFGLGVRWRGTTGPPCWGLCLGLTTLPRKDTYVTETETRKCTKPGGRKDVRQPVDLMTDAVRTLTTDFAPKTKCLRNILNIFWPNTISNQDLLQRTSSSPVIIVIKRRRWMWIGHVCRMPPDKDPVSLDCWWKTDQRSSERNLGDIPLRNKWRRTDWHGKTFSRWPTIEVDGCFEWMPHLLYQHQCQWGLSKSETSGFDIMARNNVWLTVTSYTHTFWSNYWDFCRKWRG